MGPKRDMTQTELLPPEAQTIGMPKPNGSSTPMDLLSIALNNKAAIDVIERLAALQRETLQREEETSFNEAMARVQEKIKRIAPDLENKSKNSRYASYAAIDRVIRPLYAEEGFSLSFTHAESNKPDHIRVICRCARRSHKELYQVDWPVDTKGPQGSAVMTATQATGASDSYAKRYLVKDIFNIAIGEDDTDGELGGLDDAEVEKNCAELSRAKDLAELKFLFTVAVDKARDAQDKNAIAHYMQAKDARKKELESAR